MMHLTVISVYDLALFIQLVLTNDFTYFMMFNTQLSVNVRTGTSTHR